VSDLKRRVLRQTSGALRPNCGDRCYFVGFWRFVAVEKCSRSKGLSATAIERRSLRDGFDRRMRQLCKVWQCAWSMRCSRSAAKFECSEALAPGLCFAHGSNINAHDESCGKLVASGFCAKCLAAKTGQADRAKFLLRICQIQPRRVSVKFGSWPFAGNGTAIRGYCAAFCRTIRREDFPMDRNSTRSTQLGRRCLRKRSRSSNAPRRSKGAASATSSSPPRALGYVGDDEYCGCANLEIIRVKVIVLST
jgi:hypothetical protein